MAISQSLKKYYKLNSNKYKGLNGKLSPQYGIGGSAVYCFNKKDENLVFPSVNAARKHFKVRFNYCKNNINTKE